MKPTNWKDIAELIGIAAIVASLIFVGLELRQTQSALMASTYQARSVGVTELRSDFSRLVDEVLAANAVE